jgi:hypothetical protein
MNLPTQVVKGGLSDDSDDEEVLLKNGFVSASLWLQRSFRSTKHFR